MPCTKVTVPENDESELVLENINIESNNPEEITVEYRVTNNILSGSGKRLSADVETTLDGSEVDTRSVDPPADDFTAVTFDISASPGDREVCVDFV